jgi:mono/diheme cytochrome c family protein
MKKGFKYIFTNTWTLAIALAIVATSCVKDPNSPGYEYFPDMYRSPAIEAYVDYGEVKGIEDMDKKNTLTAMHPPAGTVPFYANPAQAAIMMPYRHKSPDQDTGAYRMSAMDKNPIVLKFDTPEDSAWTAGILADGEALYNIFCDHCHGEKGDGQGKISQNGALQGIPDYAGGLKDLPEGQAFYSITYGKGLMGSHASQLNKEERWKVVHYVRSLQTKGKYPFEMMSTPVAPVDTIAPVDTVAVPDVPGM